MRVLRLELEAKFPLKALMQTTHGAGPARQPVAQLVDGGFGAGTGQPPDGQTPLSATLGADYKKGALTLGGSYVFKNGGFGAHLGQPAQLPIGAPRPRPVRAVEVRSQAAAARGDQPTCWARTTSAESSYANDAGSQTSRTLSPVRRSVRANLEMKF
jgi:outer membrane receptor for ferrienterochelin and colicins